MTATAQQFLNEMRKMIGIAESPAGSNKSAVGVAFGWNGVPWCAETISLAAKRCGIDWWTASTDQMEAWARAGRNKAKWVPANGTPLAGDIAVWDYLGDGTANHVSAVEVPRSDGMLVTIGGNESNRCQRAVRSKHHLRGYIRLPFASATAPKPPTAAKPKPISIVHPVLHLGSKGAAVKELQNKVNVVMGSNLKADGSFGSLTKKVVLNLQKRFHLVQDGVVGPKTWAVVDYVYGVKTGH